MVVGQLLDPHSDEAHQESATTIYTLILKPT